MGNASGSYGTVDPTTAASQQRASATATAAAAAATDADACDFFRAAGGRSRYAEPPRLLALRRRPLSWSDDSGIVSLCCDATVDDCSISSASNDSGHSSIELVDVVIEVGRSVVCFSWQHALGGFHLLKFTSQYLLYRYNK